MASDNSPETLLTVQKRNEIIEALKKKGAPRPCPMCGTNKWAIGDGYFSNSLQKDFSSVNLGGVGIPSIPVICSNCGFISQHAVGALGLLPKESGE